MRSETWFYEALAFFRDDATAEEPTSFDPRTFFLTIRRLRRLKTSISAMPGPHTPFIGADRSP